MYLYIFRRVICRRLILLNSRICVFFSFRKLAGTTAGLTHASTPRVYWQLEDRAQNSETVWWVMMITYMNVRHFGELALYSFWLENNSRIRWRDQNNNWQRSFRGNEDHGQGISVFLIQDVQGPTGLCTIPYKENLCQTISAATTPLICDHLIP